MTIGYLDPEGVLFCAALRDVAQCAVSRASPRLGFWFRWGSYCQQKVRVAPYHKSYMNPLGLLHLLVYLNG